MSIVYVVYIVRDDKTCDEEKFYSLKLASMRCQQLVERGFDVRIGHYIDVI